MPSNDRYRVADLTVKVNKANLPERAYRDLLEVTVQEDLDAPATFALRLSSWDGSKLAISWADDDLFTLGNEVEISFGYQGSVSPVMKGEITGLDLEIAAGRAPTVIVRGYDRRHRLLRGARTRSFVNMKDSAIAEQIAAEHHLQPDVVDSGVIHELVLQHAQTDLELLAERAEAIGYEVVVEGEALYFGPPRNHEKKALSLALDGDVLELYPRLSSQGQTAEVRVMGWDPQAKAAVLGAALLDAPASDAGLDFGPSAADGKFGKEVVTLVDRAVRTKGEADAIARGQLATRSLGFIHGEGTCLGRPDLKAGIVVEILELGRRFSGAYYVTSVSHSYSPRQGYRTGFTVRRSAA